MRGDDPEGLDGFLSRLWKKLCSTSVCLGVVKLGARASSRGTGCVCSSSTRPTDGRSRVDVCIEGPMALRAGAVDTGAALSVACRASRSARKSCSDGTCTSSAMADASGGGAGTTRSQSRVVCSACAAGISCAHASCHAAQENDSWIASILLHESQPGGTSRCWASAVLGVSEGAVS